MRMPLPSDETTPAVPRQVRAGIRWLATAAGAVTVTTIGATFRNGDGPRPVPLLLVGLALAVLGGLWDRHRPNGAVGELAIVVGAGALLLAAQAWVAPDADQLDAFLGVAGLCFLVLGVVRNDRRPVVVGVAQWAIALARPVAGGDTFRHCLLATDLEVALPRILPVVGLGVVALGTAMVLRATHHHLEAGRGLETSGLLLVLGGLTAKALELPGHPFFCGTGDAIDAGWGLLLVAVATAVGVLGVRWTDQLWAASGLGAATIFGLAAISLEANPWWGLLVGVPLTGILLWLELRRVPWPRRDDVVAPPRDVPTPHEDPLP